MKTKVISLKNNEITQDIKVEVGKKLLFFQQNNGKPFWL